MPDSVIGAAEIVIRPVVSGFETELAAQTNAPLGNFGKRAEKAGEEGGQKLSKGFGRGTSGIASALGNLGVPFTNLGGRLTQTADKMAAVDRQGSHLGATMAALGGKTLAAVGVGFAGVAAAGVDLAVKQEKVTTSIANSERISKKAARAISEAFMNTASSAIYSGRAIGEAFQPVAGVLGAIQGHALDAGEAMKFMSAAMALAEASGNQLGTTTETLAKVMQAYKVGVEGAGHASDVLWNTSRQTGIGIDQLATVLGRVKGKLGDLAPTLGESAGLINTLAKNGAVGRVAVSALSVSLSTLTGNSKATDAMAQQLGVHIFDSKGKFEGLRSVLEQLQKPMSELEPKYQMIATKALFGGAANKQLLSVILQGPKAFEAATKAVERHGSAEDAAKAQGETLENQLAALRAEAENLATAVGETLVPVLVKMAKGLFEGVEWLKKHETAAKALATVIIGVLGGAITAFVAQKVTSFIVSVKGMVASLAQLVGMSSTAAAAVTADGTAMAGSFMSTAVASSTMAGTITIGETTIASAVTAADDTIIASNEAAGLSFTAMLGPIGAVTAAVGYLVTQTKEGHELLEALGIGGHRGIHAEGPSSNTEQMKRFHETENKIALSKGGGIMGYFMSKGLSAAAAAGIVGNVQQESNFDPNAAGGGLFQYIGSRAASGRGSAYQQLEATWKELSGPYRSVLNELRHAKTPQQAAKIFSEGFERPGEPMLANRERYAAQAFKAHPQHAAELKHTAAMENHTKALEGTGRLLEKAKSHKAKAEAYVDPFLGAHGLRRGREDEGIDFTATPGSRIGAIGAGIINKIIPNWFKGQPLIEERLTSGAHKGQYVYYAEQINKAVREGQHVKAGQLIGTVAAHGTGLELGFGAGGGRTLAQATTGYKEGEKTVAAKEFSKFLASVGKGGTELQIASKVFEAEVKAMVKKLTADKKEGESQLTKITAAIQSGGVKELSAVVGGKHDKWLATLEKRLSADHTSALDKLVTKLVSAHTKALEALKIALVKAAEKATAERLKKEDTIHALEAEAAATHVADATKVRLDQIAEEAPGGMTATAHAQVALDKIVEYYDDLVSHLKIEQANTSGHGEGAEAIAAQNLVNAENQAKVAEAQARAALEVTTAEERNRTEKERLKVEQERLAEERKTTTGATSNPPANFSIVIPDGTKLSAAELLQEISFHIHAGTLPTAT